MEEAEIKITTSLSNVSGQLYNFMSVNSVQSDAVTQCYFLIFLINYMCLRCLSLSRMHALNGTHYWSMDASTVFKMSVFVTYACFEWYTLLVNGCIDCALLLNIYSCNLKA